MVSEVTRFAHAWNIYIKVNKWKVKADRLCFIKINVLYIQWPPGRIESAQSRTSWVSNGNLAFSEHVVVHICVNINYLFKYSCEIFGLVQMITFLRRIV
jgi:hypothetical protein